MKNLGMRILAISCFLFMLCLTVQAESIVFSVTSVVRDASIDLAANAIHQQVGIQTVPEPSSILLFGSAMSGVIGILARRRRARK
jgi:hypothetical protein